MDLIVVWAIPFFFALLGLEILASQIARRKDHLLEDMVSDISCGIGEQVSGAFIHTAIFSGYILLYHQGALFHLDAEHWSTWIVGLLSVDFAYYWWHRFSHRTHLGWATHVPHHQSQDYNLAVALRQSWTAKVSIAPFHWPLALLGLPPIVFLVSEGIRLLYQFWIHTRLIDRLGPLEWILNTPSHHRVHHGIENKYLDRNYAGMLIIWDRLFGTFVEEQEEPTYGTVRPYQSWDPLWANLIHFFAILRLSKKADTWSERVLIWFRPPEWKPKSMGGSYLPMAAVGRAQDLTWRHRSLAPGCRAYVVLWLGVITLCSMALLLIFERLPLEPALCLGIGIIGSTWTTAQLMRGSRFSLRMELIRLVSLAMASATWILDFQPQLGVAILALCLGCATWLWRHEAWFRA
jgi:sterol desaturase/sphingolipid hydroxylase (fatty acid hydroxylase superfamily)